MILILQLWFDAICSLHSQITLRQSSGEPHQTTPRMVSARAKRGRIEPHELVLDDSLFNVRGLVENAIVIRNPCGSILR
jgi:hypothetical protein